MDEKSLARDLTIATTNKMPLDDPGYHDKSLAELAMQTVQLYATILQALKGAKLY